MSRYVSSDDCFSPEDIDAFVAGRMAPVWRQALETHMASCSGCREVVSALLNLEDPTARSLAVTSDSTARTADVRVSSGARIGRYVVLDRLGGGGMGVVYSALDPDLGRKVALKLLRGDAKRPAHELGNRLRREAQAMARLAHPNVVTVFDVSTWEDRIFIAMELVEGQTLSQWLAASPRSWREVVARFLPAGHGLAAAHEAGLVHCDFKPANVLIGRDGRVRVSDFGLADIDSPVSSVTPPGELTAETSLRASIAGTPYYMAPEALLGEPSDARRDQFSFCVALYSALTGQHPFDGERMEDIMTATMEGRLRSPSRPGPMPRWLHRALLRGLALDPAERHPSMEDLLACLERRTSRRRLTALAWSAVALTLVASVLASRRGDDLHVAGGRAAGLPRVRGYDDSIFANDPETLEAYDRQWVAQQSGACESPRARCSIRATNILRDAHLRRPGDAWRTAGSAAIDVDAAGGHPRLVSGGTDGAIAQDVPWIVAPGRSYQASIRVRGVPGQAPLGGRLTLRSTDAGKEILTTTPFVASADWSPVSATLSPRAHFSRFRAEIDLGGPGIVELADAELLDVELIDASFEDASDLHRSVAWSPVNYASEVRARSVAAPAFDGARVLEVRTARRDGSVAQDTARSPLVGATYTFSAWLRAGRGAPVIEGNLVLWALGENQTCAVTGYRVGSEWTKIQVSLAIEDYGYSALRAEIYLGTENADLVVDAAEIVPAGLRNASFEKGTDAWRSPDPPGTVETQRIADPSSRGPTGLFWPNGTIPFAKDGGHWLRVTANQPGGSLVQDLRDALAGTTYTFSAWVRAAPDTRTPVRGALFLRHPSSHGRAGYTPFHVTTDWTLVTTTLDVEAGDPTALQVGLALADPGTAIDIDGTRLTGANPILPDPAAEVTIAGRAR